MKSMVVSCAILAMGATLVPGSASAYAEPAQQGGGMFPRACRSQQTGGAVVGALIGGLIGSRVAGRGDRTEGTVIGGLLGAAAGATVGRQLNSCQEALRREALAEAWRNQASSSRSTPEGDWQVAVVPVGETREVDGERCMPVSVQISDDPNPARGEANSRVCEDRYGNVVEKRDGRTYQI